MTKLKHYTFLINIIAITLSTTTFAAKYNVLKNFGSNPGELSAQYYLPENQSNALVILLHGCTQNGIELAENSGLLYHAKQLNLALLIPQQSDKNNIKTCFNWFSPQDITKDMGEILSLKQMIDESSTIANTRNVYVIGLSAGGAMASTLLVHYPERFKGGALIAGVPYPCADSLIKAISCMKAGPSSSVSELAQLIKAPKNSVIPKLSIWTGEDDQVVHPKNSSDMASQWANAYQLKSVDKKKASVSSISQWHDNNNEVQIEFIELSNFGHGLAVTGLGNGGGKTAPYLLKSSISTVERLLEYWKLDIQK